MAFHNGEGCIVEKGSGYQIWQYVYLFIYFFFLGGGGVFGALSLEEYQIQDGVGQFSLFCHL